MQSFVPINECNTDYFKIVFENLSSWGIINLENVMIWIRVSENSKVQQAPSIFNPGKNILTLSI